MFCPECWAAVEQDAEYGLRVFALLGEMMETRGRETETGRSGTRGSYGIDLRDDVLEARSEIRGCYPLRRDSLLTVSKVADLQETLERIEDEILNTYDRDFLGQRCSCGGRLYDDSEMIRCTRDSAHDRTHSNWLDDQPRP